MDDHLIYRTQLNLTVENKDDLKSIESRIKRLLNELFRNELAEELSILFPEDQFVRIEKLAVDLGEMSIEQVDEEFKERLLVHMKRELSKHTQKITYRHEEHGIKLLSFFLENGRLPWWAINRNIDFSDLITSLIRKSPTELKSLLKEKSKAGKHTIDRIYFQLDEKTIDAIIVMFDPGWKDSARTLNSLLDTLKQHDFAKASENWSIKEVLKIVLKSEVPTRELFEAYVRSVLTLSISKILSEPERLVLSEQLTKVFDKQDQQQLVDSLAIIQKAQSELINPENYQSVLDNFYGVITEDNVISVIRYILEKGTLPKQFHYMPQNQFNKMLLDVVKSNDFIQKELTILLHNAGNSDFSLTILPSSIFDLLLDTQTGFVDELTKELANLIQTLIRNFTNSNVLVSDKFMELFQREAKQALMKWAGFGSVASRKLVRAAVFNKQIVEIFNDSAFINFLLKSNKFQNGITKLIILTAKKQPVSLVDSKVANELSSKFQILHNRLIQLFEDAYQKNNDDFVEKTAAEKRKQDDLSQTLDLSKSNENQVGNLPESQLMLDVLRHYIVYLELPWWSSSIQDWYLEVKDSEELEDVDVVLALLPLVARANRKTLIQMLHSLFRDSIILNRAYNLLPYHFFEKLLDISNPNIKIATINQWIERLFHVFRVADQTIEGTERQAKRKVFEYFLSTLKERESRTLKDHLKEIILVLLKVTGISRQELLKSFENIDLQTLENWKFSESQWMNVLNDIIPSSNEELIFEELSQKKQWNYLEETNNGLVSSRTVLEQFMDVINERPIQIDTFYSAKDFVFELLQSIRKHKVERDLLEKFVMDNATERLGVIQQIFGDELFEGLYRDAESSTEFIKFLQSFVVQQTGRLKPLETPAVQDSSEDYSETIKPDIVIQSMWTSLFESYMKGMSNIATLPKTEIQFINERLKGREDIYKFYFQWEKQVQQIAQPDSELNDNNIVDFPQYVFNIVVAHFFEVITPGNNMDYLEEVPYLQRLESLVEQLEEDFLVNVQLWIPIITKGKRKPRQQFEKDSYVQLMSSQINKMLGVSNGDDEELVQTHIEASFNRVVDAILLFDSENENDSLVDDQVEKVKDLSHKDSKSSPPERAESMKIDSDLSEDNDVTEVNTITGGNVNQEELNLQTLKPIKEILGEASEELIMSVLGYFLRFLEIPWWSRFQSVNELQQMLNDNGRLYYKSYRKIFKGLAATSTYKELFTLLLSEDRFSTEDVARTYLEGVLKDLAEIQSMDVDSDAYYDDLSADEFNSLVTKLQQIITSRISNPDDQEKLLVGLLVALQFGLAKEYQQLNNKPSYLSAINTETIVNVIQGVMETVEADNKQLVSNLKEWIKLVEETKNFIERYHQSVRRQIELKDSINNISATLTVAISQDNDFKYLKEELESIFHLLLRSGTFIKEEQVVAALPIILSEISGQNMPDLIPRIKSLTEGISIFESFFQAFSSEEEVGQEAQLEFALNEIQLRQISLISLLIKETKINFEKPYQLSTLDTIIDGLKDQTLFDNFDLDLSDEENVLFFVNNLISVLENENVQVVSLENPIDRKATLEVFQSRIDLVQSKPWFQTVQLDSVFESLSIQTDLTKGNDYLERLEQLKEKAEKSQELPFTEFLAHEMALELIRDNNFLVHFKEEVLEYGLQISEEDQEFELPEKHDWLKLDDGDRIFITNAGLILLWPFYSRLFKNLGYVEKGEFVDESKQERATHLMQYLLNFSEDTPEHLMVLNKLICGMSADIAIKRRIKLTKKEKNEAKLFLTTIKGQWKEMKTTSIETFQNSFLKRDGILEFKDGNWNLKVENTAIDVLLTRLPWGLSIVRFSWSESLIFVEWKPTY